MRVVFAIVAAFGIVIPLLVLGLSPASVGRSPQPGQPARSPISSPTAAAQR